MSGRYQIRPASLDDIEILVQHRLAMFADMGVSVDDSIAPAFRRWLSELMPAGTYRAWLVETDTHEVAAGGGITILPWPPGPRYPTGQLAFVRVPWLFRGPEPHDVFWP